MARANVNINVSAEVITPPTLPDGGKLPWKLVRIDVKNLTVKVRHVLFLNTQPLNTMKAEAFPVTFIFLPSECHCLKQPCILSIILYCRSTYTSSHCLLR